jgi:uncharacterized protein
LNASGLERFVLDLALTGKIQLCVSTEIFAEYEGVLARPKFAIDPRKLAASLALIRSAARMVAPRRKLNIALDPADNKFLECAEAARAAYVVTGNKRHFPGGLGTTKIVNARELIGLLIRDLRIRN